MSDEEFFTITLPTLMSKEQMSPLKSEMLTSPSVVADLILPFIFFNFVIPLSLLVKILASLWIISISPLITFNSIFPFVLFR